MRWRVPSRTGDCRCAVPMEPAAAITLTSCKDNHDVAHRMLALHERLADPYELAAETVIVGQLRLAGIAAGGVLKSAFPVREAE